MRLACAVYALLLICAVCSCGDDGQDTVFDDCRDPDHSCYEPFVCSVSDETAEYGCFSTEGTTVTCTEQISPPSMPMQQNEEGFLLHWAGTACVATSYASGLAEYADDIAAAVDAWGQIACMELCLLSPTQNDQEPDTERAERGIHFAVLGASDDGISRFQVTYEMTTGRLVNVVHFLRLDGPDDLTIETFVRAVGYGLGLDIPRGLSVAEGDTVIEDARTTICAVYGSSPLCEN
jgi:hypothetical protein